MDDERVQAYAGEPYPGARMVAFTVGLHRVRGAVRPRAPVDWGTVKLCRQERPEIVGSASHVRQRQCLETRLFGQDR